MKPDEIKKLDAYFKRTLNPQMVVKARPRKDDSRKSISVKSSWALSISTTRTATVPTTSPWQSWTWISNRDFDFR